MKKYKILILILGLSMIFFGCGKKTEKDPEDVVVEEDETVVVDEETPVEETEDDNSSSRDLYKKFDEVYYTKENSRELVELIDENISNVDEPTATGWINSLETKLNRELEIHMNELFQRDPDMELMNIEGTSRYFSEEKVDEIQNEELKNLVKELFATHYKLINVEGAFYPLVDYESLAGYNEYISQELGKYLEIKAMDSKEYPFSDGGRVISLEDLRNRIVETEKYLTDYQDGLRREEMVKEYRLKLRGYMEGLPNTPISDFEDGKIIPEVLEDFKKAAQLEDTTTGKILKNYVDDIENNDFVIDEEILRKADDYVNEAFK